MHAVLTPWDFITRVTYPGWCFSWSMSPVSLVGSLSSRSLDFSLSLVCRPPEHGLNGTAGAVTRTYSSDQWQAIEGACGPLYVPTLDDRGLKLRVQCTPARCAVLLSRPHREAVRCTSFCCTC